MELLTYTVRQDALEPVKNFAQQHQQELEERVLGDTPEGELNHLHALTESYGRDGNKLG